MEKEIQATVKLWSEQIRSGDQDMGYGVGDALATFVKRLASPITDEQIQIFEEALMKGLRKKIKECAAWDHEKPEFGAIWRGLFTDYHPDETLAEAAKKAGIPTICIPIKSQTYTCPGYVEYAFGYSAKRERLIINQ